MAPRHSRASGEDPRLALAAANDAPALGPDDTRAGLMVGQPPSRTLGVLGAGLLALLATGLFLTLNARRLDRAPPLLAAPLEAAPRTTALPVLELPEIAPHAPPPPPIEPVKPAKPFVSPRSFTAPVFAPPTAPSPGSSASSAPALVVDYGPARATASPSTSPTIGARGVPGPGVYGGAGAAASGSIEALALAGGSGDEPDRVTATRLETPGRVVPQGAIIPAVLETAIDSDLPGFARAVVSRDVLSFDGKAVLIPRGSRLIGRYKSDLAPGQSRVFVAWTRVMRPDGVSIQLDSPVADPLGRGGLEGRVDRRLFERFGGAAVLSTLTAGISALSNGRSSQVIIGSPINTGEGTNGGRGQQISPVVRVAQGVPIRIFVARDLDFSGVGEVPGADR